MKHLYFRLIVLFAILAIASASKAQVTQAVSINTSGNTNYTGAILDLSNQNIAGAVGFLPPYVTLTNATLLSPVTGTPGQLSGLIVYNTNNSASNGLHGAGLYYWNNNLTPPSWVSLDSLSNGGSLTLANNGTSVSGTTLQLGGNNLIQATNIPLNGNNLSVTGSATSSNFTSTGQVGIGNTTPNAEAVVDFNNSTNLGVLLPGMTTAQLPPITAAQNGLIVYNTTISCPEIAYNGSWYWFGFSHGTLKDTSYGIMYWTVPPCVTSITIVAAGGVGGGGSGLGGKGAVVTYNGCAVTPGQVLGLAAGQEGYEEYMGGGGGGGSFVWNASNTTTPLVVAGGGGGFGSGAGYDASITINPNGDILTNGAEGAGGNGGTHGSGVAGGGGGGGWNTLTGSPVASTNQLGAGGVGLPGGFQGGNANTNSIKQSGQGGFGGGGGEGASTNASNWGGGGGGGGYNGGGGGNGTNGVAGEYGGAGGGSCINGATPVSPNTAVASNTGNGYIIITW